MRNANAYDRRTYETLLEHMGPQHWWPAESSEEMMLGAILVQNTNWKNADMALLRLKEKQTLILKNFIVAIN